MAFCLFCQPFFRQLAEQKSSNSLNDFSQNAEWILAKLPDCCIFCNSHVCMLTCRKFRQVYPIVLEKNRYFRFSSAVAHFAITARLFPFWKQSVVRKNRTTDRGIFQNGNNHSNGIYPVAEKNSVTAKNAILIQSIFQFSAQTSLAQISGFGIGLLSFSNG